MKLAATHRALSWARDDLDSWENEGGAVNFAPSPVSMVGWPPASIIDPAPVKIFGADKGITDTNSLTILRLSLLLLVPALAGIAIFWGATAMSGS
jgi:hypothetical protein